APRPRDAARRPAARLDPLPRHLAADRGLPATPPMSTALTRRARVVILVLFSLLLAGVVVLSADAGARAEARGVSASVQASAATASVGSPASASVQTTAPVLPAATGDP